MQKHHKPYPAEFRAQMVELVKRAHAEELASEFEPTAQTIYNWVAQADRDAGKRQDGLTTAEREELPATAQVASSRKSGRSCQKPRPGSPGDRNDAREGFEFVKANQATFDRDHVRGCWGSPPAAITPGSRSVRERRVATRICSAHPSDSCALARNVRDAPHPCRVGRTRQSHVGRKRMARLMRVAGCAA